MLASSVRPARLLLLICALALPAWASGQAEAPKPPGPPANAPAGPIRAAAGSLPDGVNANAGAAAATMPVPTGATRQMVESGDQIFHGRVGGAACSGCHGSDGTGTPQGPDLTAKKRLWGDGSYRSITRIITDGVPSPRSYPDPMPPMGGAQLSNEQVSEVAAYVWGLSHR